MRDPTSFCMKKKNIDGLKKGAFSVVFSVYYDKHFRDVYRRDTQVALVQRSARERETNSSDSKGRVTLSGN